MAKAFSELEEENKRLRAALERIRDTPHVVYEPVRLIAKWALEKDTELNTELNTKKSDV
tara:strand:- start:548 stop:724 length:177 start_codon:yes stop_codon:yes gene_type:complete